MKRRLTYDEVITIIISTILVFHLLFNVLFQSGDKMFRLLLVLVTVGIAKFIFSVTFMKHCKLIYILILTFIIMAMYVGNILNIYQYINHYDKILHFISGIIISILGFSIYINYTHKVCDKINPIFALIFIVSFSIAMAGVWEIWEFSTDRLFGFNSQNNSLIDTMLDIIMGTLGCLIILPMEYSYIKGRNIRFFRNLISEIIK
ncbi:hypothetical protein [Clostridium botulinum]|uniref:hypothetical protein n=1 Tax=Clostridium botulinum TaxID=1491 RepID=UPI0013F7BE49|nr:hypothetical protein [Clostridium botulinum]MBY6809781.1 hypothetical protein [Clostridium botulinum]MBY6823186.1 hypothetical protein [Clostridium botulinum]MBY6833834.1 hypothetical protein [Clostridium botulinum]MBY6971896.1 hypothetical protein [Clostridium botulinum]NFO13143.1 hypothetical protein [Clostridium botulinum]